MGTTNGHSVYSARSREAFSDTWAGVFGPHRGDYPTLSYAILLPGRNWGLRPKSGPETRFPARKRCCITLGRLTSCSVWMIRGAFLYAKQVPGWIARTEIGALNKTKTNYPMLCNSASGLEVVFPGWISAGFQVGKPLNRPSGRPKACRRPVFSVFPIRIRPKSGPVARFSAGF